MVMMYSFCWMLKLILYTYLKQQYFLLESNSWINWRWSSVSWNAMRWTSDSIFLNWRQSVWQVRNSILYLEEFMLQEIKSSAFWLNLPWKNGFYDLWSFLVLRQDNHLSCSCDYEDAYYLQSLMWKTHLMNGIHLKKLNRSNILFESCHKYFFYSLILLRSIYRTHKKIQNSLNKGWQTGKPFHPSYKNLHQRYMNSQIQGPDKKNRIKNEVNIIWRNIDYCLLTLQLLLPTLKLLADSCNRYVPALDVRRLILR